MANDSIHAVAICRNCEYRNVGTIALALAEQHVAEYGHDVEVTETKTTLLRYEQ